MQLKSTFKYSYNIDGQVFLITKKKKKKKIEVYSDAFMIDFLVILHSYVI